MPLAAYRAAVSSCTRKPFRNFASLTTWFQKLTNLNLRNKWIFHCLERAHRNSRSNSALLTITLTVNATPKTAQVTVVNPGTRSGTSNVVFFEVTLPTSAAAFGASSLSPFFSPLGVATADFNRDGKLDLAVANIGNNNVSVLLGNGNGTFQGALDYWPGAPESIREYRLRLDSPPLEEDAEGRLKTKFRYLRPPGKPNMLYFNRRTAPEWLKDASLPIVIVEGEKKCEAAWHLAWHDLGDTAERPRWLPTSIPEVYGFRGKNGIIDDAQGKRRTV